MNYRVVLNVLGTVIKFLGISLLAPLLVALYYHEPESIRIFALSYILTFLTGLLLEKIFRSEFEELSNRESILIVAAGWMLAAVFGGIPFVNPCPASLLPVQAFFPI
jgi:trk system potassium uptake protein TrkH